MVVLPAPGGERWFGLLIFSQKSRQDGEQMV
jgi:hypothetical protein